MDTIFAFPGSFCPPTYGHLEVLRQASTFIPKVYVICSRNPGKEDNWFSPDECVEMWRTYDLSENVEVLTLERAQALGWDLSEIVMVRGLRKPGELYEDTPTLEYNFSKFGIKRYMHIVTSKDWANVSSSKAREVAGEVDLDALRHIVSPGVVTKLLEKVLGIASLTLVVGQPGGGKSTFLTVLKATGVNVHTIDTDQFSRMLRPMLTAAYPERDLVDLAVHHDDELMHVIGKPWMAMLSQALGDAPKGSHVFVEVPYGLVPFKALYKYLGARVLYVGPESTEVCRKRLTDRGTPQLLPFLDLVPGIRESRTIAKEQKLELEFVDTDCTLPELEAKANAFAEKLKEAPDPMGESSFIDKVW